MQHNVLGKKGRQWENEVKLLADELKQWKPTYHGLDGSVSAVDELLTGSVGEVCSSPGINFLLSLLNTFLPFLLTRDYEKFKIIHPARRWIFIEIKQHSHWYGSVSEHSWTCNWMNVRMNKRMNTLVQCMNEWIHYCSALYLLPPQHVSRPWSCVLPKCNNLRLWVCF